MYFTLFNSLSHLWLDKQSMGPAVAINAALLALLQNTPTVYLIRLVQDKEEQTLNSSGQHRRHHLVNRLYLRQA